MESHAVPASGTDGPLCEGTPNLDRDRLGHPKINVRFARRNQWPQFGLASCANARNQLSVLKSIYRR
jgi:hypothetical protein